MGKLEGKIALVKGTNSERYLEDFDVGQIYGSGRIKVEEDRIKTFAVEFDPQPFHLDEIPRAARYSPAWRRAAGIPPRAR